MTEERKNELRERVRQNIEEARSRLMDFARRHNRGGCKILSEGNRCTCLLCDITTLYVNAIISFEFSDGTRSKPDARPSLPSV